MNPELELIVERELDRLGWLAKDEETSHLAMVLAQADFPYGWVKIKDVNGSWGCGDVLLIASQLSCLSLGLHNYADCMRKLNLPCQPWSYSYWPERLKSVTRIDSTPDWHLVTVATNAGLRFAGGPHNDQYDCLWNAFNADMLRETVEEVAKDWEEESSRKV